MVKFIVVSCRGIVRRRTFRSDCFSLILYYLAGIAEFSDAFTIEAARGVGVLPKCMIKVNIPFCRDADSFVRDVEAFLDASL